MNSEPFFVFDEKLEEFQQNLKSLMFELKHPKIKKQARFLQTFVRACIGTYKKPDYKISFLEPEKEAPTVEKIVKKIPIGYTIWPIPKPNAKQVSKFQIKPKYREVSIEKVIEPSHRELIIDNVTKKVLASAEAGKTYKIKEPELRGRDVKVIKRILNMHPKDMRTVWGLIKKEKLADVEATNIKYYIANELFAFGKIEPLLHDPEINVIKCDGVGKYIRVNYRGNELRTNFVFKDNKILDNYVYNIARKLGENINEDNPIVDKVHRKFRIHLILGIRTSSKFVFKRLE